MTEKELKVWKKLKISSCPSLNKYLEMREAFKEMYNENLTEEENLELLLLYKEII